MPRPCGIAQKDEAPRACPRMGGAWRGRGVIELEHEKESPFRVPLRRLRRVRRDIQESRPDHGLQRPRRLRGSGREVLHDGVELRGDPWPADPGVGRSRQLELCRLCAPGASVGDGKARTRQRRLGAVHPLSCRQGRICHLLGRSRPRRVPREREESGRTLERASTRVRSTTTTDASILSTAGRRAARG